MRRTKIVCTIGPACSKRSVMERLLRAGMDVARLNFSHGSHEQHAQVITDLRTLAAKLDRPLGILQDLSGPKIRLGAFTSPEIVLKRGELVCFSAEGSQSLAETRAALQRTTRDADSCCILPLPVPELIAAMRPNCTLLLDDGKIGLRVTRCQGESGAPDRLVWARVQVGGILKPRKGVTAPGLSFQMPAITEKDLDDLRFGLAQGVDMVAASYVRCKEDLDPLFEVMRECGRRVPLIAKIEKFEAVRNLESILAVVDGIMVARGDLGVEMPFDEVPIVQKRIIRICNRVGKPVITATQMLESMIENPRPTRAEATDVANAILDGTDAVMLSGETAAGQFPEMAVKTMARIALRTEAAFFQETGYATRLPMPSDVTTAVARATADIACELKVVAILCATTSGNTARRVAQYRPSVPILGVTTSQETYRCLTLTWGVQPCLVRKVADTEDMMAVTIAAAQNNRFVKLGDQVVLTAGVPVNSPGTTNLIKVHRVGEPLHAVQVGEPLHAAPRAL